MPPLTPEEEAWYDEMTRRLTEEAARYKEEQPTRSQRALKRLEELSNQKRSHTPPQMNTVRSPTVEVKIDPMPSSARRPSGFPKPSQNVVNLIYILLTLGGVGTVGWGVNKQVPEAPKPLPPEMVTKAELDASKEICVKARDEVQSLRNEYDEFNAEVGSALRAGSCAQVPGKKKGTYVCGGFILRSSQQNRRVTQESLDPFMRRIE